MAKTKPEPATVTTLLLLFLFLLLLHTTANTETPSTYIIHVSPPTSTAAVLRSLPNHLALPSPTVIYNYTLTTHGFSAILTPSQASHLRADPTVLAVVPDDVLHLHTTYTPSFLHLSNSTGICPESDYASDVVIGVLDTGIYPHSRASFDDTGLSAPPNSWKGSCEPSIPCNRKLVGAKFFSRGYEAAFGFDNSVEVQSPLDTEGHGTHTASTAAGAEVPGAGFYSYARGTARGTATKARIAAYKVCWSKGCLSSDVLAAMDVTIADGIDVISLSVGGSGLPKPYYMDPIVIAAFGAVAHGVVVSCSAGNTGPGKSTVTNVAPWMLTVGASTVDRDFPADVVLGDGSVLPGVSLYTGDPLNSTELFPLVSGASCGSKVCNSRYLDPTKVAGKIVVCDRGEIGRLEKGDAVKSAGGVGMIVANTDESGEELLADSYLLPAANVGAKAGNKIRNYVQSDPSPVANIIIRGTVIGQADPTFPKVASFSSRGPSYRTPEIIKPDVIAPGVNILAAWTGEATPTNIPSDTRHVEFNIISGTSMSCPHVSGIAAMLKKAHPDWSPAAIKSALMTTAYNVDNSGQTIGDSATGGESTPFVRGSGHVDPNRALDPGLVYDMQHDDYVAFLCASGYTSRLIQLITRDGTRVDCSATPKKVSSPGGVNYPSFAVAFSYGSYMVTYTRELKNVGSGAAVYEVTVSNPPNVNVTVTPSKLSFGAVGEVLSYEITFATAGGAWGSSMFGSIAWSDGVHVVNSPIAVTMPQWYVASA